MAIDVLSPGTPFRLNWTDRSMRADPSKAFEVHGEDGSTEVAKDLQINAAVLFPGTTGAAVTAGRAVSIDANGNFIHAVVTTGAVPPQGVATATLASGQPIKVVTSGIARGVLSAATPGTRFFLTGTAGQMSTTAPAVTGNALVVMGYAISATDLFVLISDRGTAP